MSTHPSDALIFDLVRSVFPTRGHTNHSGLQELLPGAGSLGTVSSPLPLHFALFPKTSSHSPTPPFSHVIVEFTFYFFLLTHDLSFWSLKYLFHALSSKRVLLGWAFSISGEKFICYSRPFFCLIVFVRYSYLFPLVCLLLFLVVYFLWPWWSFPFFHCSF